MTLYLDMMARILTNSPVSSTSSHSSTPKRSKSHLLSERVAEIITTEHKEAMRKIEGLICTSRESLLGSSAWKGDFYEQLRTRPFYAVLEVRI